MNYGAIARDFGPKILRPRKIFEIFGPKSAANRTKSHEPQRADARHSVWGPLWLAAMSAALGQPEFRRNLTRFRTENFRGREKFSKFSVGNPSRIARNLTRRSMPTLDTVVGDL